jgi:hypothetical protein
MRFIACVLLTAGLAFEWSAPWQAAARGQAASRLFLIVVDDLHIDFRSTARIRWDLMKRLLQLTARAGDKVRMVSTGYSSVDVPPTSDPAVVQAALARITGGGLRPAEILDGKSRDELVRRAQVTLRTVTQAIEAMPAADGKGNVVLLVTGGFDLSPRTERAALVTELEELTRTANRVGATIYAFDARALVGTPEPLLTGIDADAWNAYLEAARTSLRTLVEATRGRTVVTLGEVDDAFAQIDAGAPK